MPLLFPGRTGVPPANPSSSPRLWGLPSFGFSALPSSWQHPQLQCPCYQSRSSHGCSSLVLTPLLMPVLALSRPLMSALKAISESKWERMGWCMLYPRVEHRTCLEVSDLSGFLKGLDLETLGVAFMGHSCPWLVPSSSEVHAHSLPWGCLQSPGPEDCRLCVWQLGWRELGRVCGRPKVDALCLPTSP